MPINSGAREGVSFWFTTVKSNVYRDYGSAPKTLLNLRAIAETKLTLMGGEKAKLVVPRSAGDARLVPTSAVGRNT
jgi:hypothetical protein